jgi:hypothetical protein
MADAGIAISASQIGRILAADAVAPHKLVKEKFTWATASGNTWAFEHTRGIIRSNGNKENTGRFTRQ